MRATYSVAEIALAMAARARMTVENCILIVGMLFGVIERVRLFLRV